MTQRSHHLTFGARFPLRPILSGLALCVVGYLTQPMGTVLMVVGSVILLSVRFGGGAQDLINFAGGEREE